MNATVDNQKPPTGTAVVVIACKLPSGLVIEVGIDKNGNKSEKYRSVKLAGPDKNRIAGNPYGFTNVPKDLWDEWIRTHGDMTYVKKDLVFSMSDPSRAQAKALELSGLKTGLESLQERDDRLGKGFNKKVEEDKTQRTMGPVVAAPQTG